MFDGIEQLAGEGRSAGLSSSEGDKGLKIVKASHHLDMLAAAGRLEREVRSRCIKSALDLIIMSAATEKPICGYDIITLVYQEFKILLSPGTVYPVIKTLEERGLIESKQDGRRRIYSLASRGHLLAPQLVAEYRWVESQLLTICNM